MQSVEQLFLQKEQTIWQLQVQFCRFKEVQDQLALKEVMHEAERTCYPSLFSCFLFSEAICQHIFGFASEEAQSEFGDCLSGKVLQRKPRSC